MAVVPRVGVQRRILVVPVDCAMIRVRATLADDIDLAALGAPEGGVVIRHANTEL